MSELSDSITDNVLTFFVKRMMKRLLMRLFGLETVITHTIIISPFKKTIDKNILFLNPVIARERFDLIFNEMNSAASAKNYIKYEALQELLSSIKILTNSH